MPPEVVLRLYVAGGTLLSSRALTHLKTICETHLQGRYRLTVVDLYEQGPGAAHGEILVTPTLVRQSPLPVRRVVGDLSDTARVLAALDISDVPA